MSKYIIFGAGNFGKRAIKYYGAENVECYVDNDEKKEGTVFCGKKVIGFKDYREIASDFVTIIANAHAAEIKKQLIDNGIESFFCYTPVYEHFLEYIKKKQISDSVKSIALYGLSNDTDQIIEALRTLQLDTKISCIVKSDYDCESWSAYDYVLYDSLEKCKELVDCVVVSSSWNNIAIGAKARQIMKNSTIINPYKQIAYYDTDDIVFNPYLAETKEKTEEDWNNTVENDLNKSAVRAYVDVVSKEVPLFEFIEIETVNKCNGTCSFCPVNKHVDPRPSLKMEMSLFHKIIDELSEMNYSGELSLFSNNEPLLDDRIVELHKYAREKLPNTRIHMFTNGTLFNLELFVELIPYLDELIIDNYMQKLEMIKPVKEIYDYLLEHPELRNKVTIVLRKQNEILTSRGGDAPNRKNMPEYAGETCALPFEQMIIRPDGKVSLCCNDPIGKNTLGDVSEETLKGVWYGPKFSMVREQLALGREKWDHCKYCDTFYLY